MKIIVNVITLIIGALALVFITYGFARLITYYKYLKLLFLIQLNPKMSIRNFK
jgi:hypothetical protein